MVATIRAHPDLFGGYIGSRALLAAFTLGFACFLRMGELTYSNFDSRYDLRRSSVAFGSNGNPTLLTLSASKTDPFRLGVTTVVPTGPPDICPVRALRDLLDATPDLDPDSALFHFSGNTDFTRGRTIGYMTRALMEAGYPSHKFSGHSFRRGAATWASSIGLSALEIKTLGRWNSDCYRLYIDAGPENHMRAGHRLLHAPIYQSTLDASGIPRPGQVWRPSL